MHRILLADSDSLVLARLEAILLDRGYRVSTANSGPELEEALARPDIGLLVMDADLPGLSGLELLRMMRDSGPRLPVVLLAGSGSTNQAIEAIKLGAFGLPVKTSQGKRNSSRSRRRRSRRAGSPPRRWGWTRIPARTATRSSAAPGPCGRFTRP